MTARVLLMGLTKKFDEVVAVDTVNLEISDREFDDGQAIF